MDLSGRCIQSLLVFMCLSSTAFISSTVDSQSIVIDQLTTTQLNCTVQRYKFGDVTSSWYKTQQNGTEPVLLFVGDNPLQLKTGDFQRYNASHVDQSNGFLYQLIISGTMPQDSGQYICKVLDKNGATVLSTNISLNVIAPVQSIFLFKNVSNANETMARPNSQFRYTVGSPGSLGCHVIGGNPQPMVTLLFGMSPVQSSFVFVKKTWNGSELGFQTPSWEVITYSVSLKVLPEDDGENITCVASVQTYNASSSNTISVDAIPYFHSNGCRSEQDAAVGKKAQLSCRFHAHPAGTVTWTKVTNDTTQNSLPISDSSDGLQSAVVLNGQNDFVATLLFPKAQDSDFRLYNLTVSNDLGSNSTIIRLSKSGTGQRTICLHLLLILLTVAFSKSQLITNFNII